MTLFKRCYVVQLSGFANSSADISKAGAIARSVKGVVSVKNDILLKQQPRDAAGAARQAACGIASCRSLTAL